MPPFNTLQVVDKSYIHSLITLLDDPDPEIFNAVSEKIITQGITVVPLLEGAWGSSDSRIFQERLENLIQTIQFNTVANALTQWKDSESNNLLEGAVLVARLQFPDLSLQPIELEIKKLQKDIWLEINSNLTALEKVRVINHVIFTIHKYEPNTSNFFLPGNHLINHVVETKRGGPIMLAILYAEIAQRLGLPISCVNLPKNFVLAYQDRYRVPAERKGKDPESILFYINPFNNGSVFSRNEIELFLSRQQLEPKPEYFLPCANTTTISQLVFNLIYSLERNGNRSKANEYKKLLQILEKDGEEQG